MRLLSMSVCIAIVVGVSALSHVSPCAAQSPATLEEGFVALFDGKSLDGWEGNADYFRIQDKAIVAGSLEKKIPNNEFLCTTKQYSNFDLRAEVKLVGEGKNAGIQFRSQRIPNHHEVSGYQFDVGEMSGRPIWGALYDESRRNKMLAEGPIDSLKTWVKSNDWNQVRILAEGNHIQLFLNGHKTVDFTESQSDIAKSGVIGLQIHSGPPTEAWYRSIRIREL
jgi:hypothetical protein